MNHERKAAEIKAAVRQYELDRKPAHLRALIYRAFNDSGELAKDIVSKFCPKDLVLTSELLLLANLVEKNGGDLSAATCFAKLASEIDAYDYLNQVAAILPSDTDIDLFKRVKEDKISRDLGL